MFSKLSPIDVNNREGGGLDSNVTSRKEIVSGGHGKKIFRDTKYSETAKAVFQKSWRHMTPLPPDPMALWKALLSQQQNVKNFNRCEIDFGISSIVPTTYQET